MTASPRSQKTLGAIVGAALSSAVSAIMLSYALQRLGPRASGGEMAFLGLYFIPGCSFGLLVLLPLLPNRRIFLKASLVLILSSFSYCGAVCLALLSESWQTFVIAGISGAMVVMAWGWLIVAFVPKIKRIILVLVCSALSGIVLFGVGDNHVSSNSTIVLALLGFLLWQCPMAYLLSRARECT
jgi:hypothetical protein